MLGGSRFWRRVLFSRLEPADTVARWVNIGGTSVGAATIWVTIVFSWRWVSVLSVLCGALVIVLARMYVVWSAARHDPPTPAVSEPSKGLTSARPRGVAPSKRE